MDINGYSNFEVRGPGRKRLHPRRKRSQRIIKWVAISLIMISTVGQVIAGRSTNGKISGRLVDAQTREPIIGANVVVEEALLGGASDANGGFVVEGLPVGSYTVTISMIGYQELKLTNVEVTTGRVTELQDVLLPTEVIEGQAVVVEARFIQNTEAAMLSRRQKSQSISDGLSAEAISRSGSSQAGEAMQHVTGASVVDGKYIYVRGLGERYASTQLDGVELPSADPDRRSFQLDLIPATLLDNIVTTKTFTPDQPGNFSGGIVNLGMRSYPERLQMSIGMGAAWNSQSNLNGDFLGYSGGGSDWLGFDDGARQLPDLLSGTNEPIPSEVEARTDPALAGRLDKLSKAFSPTMAPRARRSPLNNNFSLSLGNQSQLAGRPLGYFGSFSYSRGYSSYENGQVARWKLTGNVAENDSLSNLISLTDNRGSESVLWGGMATATYQLFPGHEVKANFLRTQSGTATARYLIGPWPEQNVQFFETRALTYTERALNSWQFRGHHDFRSLDNTEIDWAASISSTSQEEPDARFFSDTFAEREFGGQDTLIYSLAPSIIRRPGRYFRQLQENSSSYQMQALIPLQLGNKTTARIKLGGSYEKKDRQFEEQLFEYWQGSGVRYDGDPQKFFSSQNTGIIGFDSTTNRYQFGNYIQEALGGYGGNYSGDQQITAAFLMIDVPLFASLRIVGGARYETTRMTVSNSQVMGRLRDNDFLPSLNITYRPTENMNVRWAYGRTLARPNFREKAPYASFEFVNDFIFNGNVDLQRSLIDNYDLRWEWFVEPGELLSVSGFYKQLKNPIERTIDVGFQSEGALVFFDNVDQARLYGIEIEVRRRLGSLHSHLQNFLFGGSISLIHSQVNIPPEELRSIRAVDPGADSRRELQGQSPLLANLNLTYENPGSGTVASLYYHLFGRHLSEVSLGGTPGVYEQAHHFLNFTLSQRLQSRLSFKLSGKNLLNDAYRFVHRFKGVEYLRQSYSTGRTFSMGLQYDLK